jgi:vacuolar-type H+-ATPase subunit H
MIKSGEKMPILTSIKTAEAKAENLRADANAKVGILLAEYKMQTDTILQQMQDDAKKQELALTAKLNMEIENAKSEISMKTTLETELINKHAESQIPQAVDFLLDKALKS